MFAPKFAAASVLALSLAVIPKVSADVLLNDNFESDSVGSAPANWNVPTSTDTVSTVIDDGTGNHVLDVNETAAAGSRPLYVPFASTTLADGDSIQMSFDIHITTAVASIPANNRAFRFGLFNSESTSSTGDDLGYIGRITTGAATGTMFDLSGEFTGTSGLFGVSGSAKHTSTTNANAVLNDNGVHTISVLLQRTGADVFATATYTTTVSGTPTTIKIGSFDDTLASTNGTYTFDELAFGNNSSGTLEYTIDNANVTYTAAAPTPEPASLGLLGMGAAGLLLRRRKA